MFRFQSSKAIEVLWICSAHKLQLIIRRPSRLRKTETPLDALEKLPCDLIAHDVSGTFITLM